MTVKFLTDKLKAAQRRLDHDDREAIAVKLTRRDLHVLITNLARTEQAESELPEHLKRLAAAHGLRGYVSSFSVMDAEAAANWGAGLIGYLNRFIGCGQYAWDTAKQCVVDTLHSPESHATTKPDDNTHVAGSQTSARAEDEVIGDN